MISGRGQQESGTHESLIPRLSTPEGPPLSTFASASYGTHSTNSITMSIQNKAVCNIAKTQVPSLLGTLGPLVEALKIS